MDRGNVALAALRGRKPASATDIERLDQDPFESQPIDQHIEPDAVTADDHQVGKVRSADQLVGQVAAVRPLEGPYSAETGVA
jgi:hypothetical protein